MSFTHRGMKLFPYGIVLSSFKIFKKDKTMRGLLAIIVMIVGLYGIGFLQALEATDELKMQLQEKSVAQANMLLAKRFEAKK